LHQPHSKISIPIDQRFLVDEAVLALIGWRVTRRFGWRGQVVFLIVVTVIGPLRDYFVAGQALGVIVLVPGPLTVLVDAACRLATTALAQAVMRVVAGPARADHA
jgi:hypothetical protein